jgi:putative salt-induced outer membrane protein
MTLRFARHLFPAAIGALTPVVVAAQAAASTTASATATASASDTSAAKRDAKPEPKPRKKPFEFTGSLGFSQAGGNANALTTTVTNRLRYTMAGWSVQQDLAFYYGEANEKVNTNFWNGGVRGERTVAERVALFMASRYDRNALQGVSNRFQQGFGVTVVAIEDARSRLNVALGGSFFQQQLTPGSVAKVSRAFPAARAAFDFRHKFSDAAFVTQTAEYLPALGDTATSYFVNSESAIVAPISKSVGLKIGYVVRFNSEPPVRNSVQLRTTDTFFSSGLTLTF